ncbi:MAG: hypothetical protein ACK4WM_09780 [Thermoflexales bacterium]
MAQESISVSPATARAREAGRLRAQSPFARTMRRLLHNRSAQVGLVIISVLALIAIFADVIAPYAYDQQIRQAGLRRRSPPCIHLLGCDPHQKCTRLRALSPFATEAKHHNGQKQALCRA